jgi:1-phosphofructokinase family hexose kinase
VIACICLHPAIDRTLELSNMLEAGTVNRTVRVHERAGGKAINVAGVLTILGAECVAITVRAGFNGAKLEGLLTAQKINHKTLEVDGETRECQALIFRDHPTEINESGPSLTARDLLELERLIPRETSWVIVSGSLPPGITLAVFSAWLQNLRARYQVAVDTSGAALRAALEVGVTLIKPNTQELEQLGSSASEIFEKYGVNVLHSRGVDGLEYVGSQGTFSQVAEKIDVINPVGAGDATLAGFIFALEQHQSVQDALKMACACGAAACLEPVAGVISQDRVQKMLEPANFQPAGVVHA